MADPIIGGPDGGAGKNQQDGEGAEPRADVKLGNADPDALIGPAAGKAQPGGAAGGQAGAGELVVEGSDRTFAQDVLDASAQVPVIVDFWAPWCGPCKQLGPALEKAVNAAGGKVKLVKIDIDQNPQIAGQLQIQSIPAVYAFAGGRPVDGFMGALPESEVKQFVDRLAQMADQLGGGQQGGDDGAAIEEALEQAAQAEQQGDHATAAAIYGQVLEYRPEDKRASVKLAAAYAKMGEIEAAREVVGNLPEGADGDPELANAIASVHAAIELADSAAGAGEKVDGLRAKVAADPEDHAARYELAEAEAALGEHEAAIDNLLTLIEKNKDWQDGAARERLLKVFEALGPTDPAVQSGRRRLSSLLFS